MSLSPFLHPFTPPAMEEDKFLTIARGEGAMLYDDKGKGYVDGMASLWYANVGYGRADVADAVADQLKKVVHHTFPPYTNEPAEQLAAKLAGLSPIADARIFFGSSGSEAVDTALKLARIAHKLAGDPERKILISRGRGYHGTNYGGTSAQGLPPNKEGWGELLSGVIQVPGDDVEALATAMADHAGRVAAVITEPVQGAGGVWPPAEGYLESVRRLCDQHGALLIFDEVITGFGRLGDWFGAAHFGVTPDLICFAKAVTSGYQPLGGVIVGPRVREALESDPAFVLKTGYTYSGHPTVCAAALANIDILEREGLLERATAIGERLSAGLTALAADGQVAEVRGRGAVWAVGLHPHQSAVAVRDRMLHLGVITRAIAEHSNTFCPPLVMTDEEIDRVVDALATATRDDG